MKKLSLLTLLFFLFAFGYAQNTALDNYLNHIGETVVVSGKIHNAAFLKNVITKPTFLNLGDTSPHHRLLIRIDTADRNKFPEPPEEYFLHKNITISGTLQDYKGGALIKITDPSMVQIGTDDVPKKDTFTGVYVRNAPTTTIVPQQVNTDTAKPVVVSQTLTAVKPDSVPKKEWIVPVKDTAAERAKEDVRILEKDFTLHTSPYKDAPVIATLHEGMRITVLTTKENWSYVQIASIDGASHVYGFIKHKNFKGLKKE